MQLQWFPGHMHRARKQIKENLNKVDLVLEVLDARAPMASKNPLLNEIIGQKPRLILLNKSDLADPIQNPIWQSTLESAHTRVILVSAVQRKSLKSITRYCKNTFKDKRWFQRRPVRAMIMGIPNVGKSTIINGLSGGKKAGVANTPGFTKDIIRYDTSIGLQIYDSPGVLWPKFEDREVGLALAALGSIRDSILPIEEAAVYFLNLAMIHYPEVLKERYQITPGMSDPLNQVGIARGVLMSGGVVNRDKAAFMLLKDLREGRLGRISLELASENK